jgi:hypothetical protein
MAQFQFWRHLAFQMVKSRTRKELKRKPPYRTPNKIELIICEGEITEKMYFDALRRKWRVQIDVISPSESEPIAVVERAINRKKEMAKLGVPYEKVWCIVDVEIPPHKTLNEAWEKARKTDGLELILTNPCIEYWFLLHFKKHTAPFGNNADVMDALKAVHRSYKKSHIGFDVLYQYRATAIKHSKEVLEEKKCGEYLRDCNPSTHVHKIVEHLQNISG